MSATIEFRVSDTDLTPMTPDYWPKVDLMMSAIRQSVRPGIDVECEGNVFTAILQPSNRCDLYFNSRPYKRDVTVYEAACWLVTRLTG